MSFDPVQPDIRLIDIASIDVPARLRPVDEAWVEALASSFSSTGQQDAITVNVPEAIRVPDFPERVELVAGAHRIAAARSLGWTTIAARIIAVDRSRARLMEIDENLIRRELTILDRALCLAERQKVYEALHPQTKRGVAGGKARQRQAADKLNVSASAMLAFADDAAERTRLGKRTIQDAVALVRDLSDELIPRIQPMPLADHRAHLRLLANQDADRQRAIVDTIEAGDAGTVPDAIAMIDGARPPSESDRQWRLATNAVSRLDRGQRRLIFRDYRDEIVQLAQQEGWI